MKTAAMLLLMLFISGCSRPDDGFADGQIVYSRITCKQMMISGWDWIVHDYFVVGKDGRGGDAMPDLLVASRDKCVRWDP